MSERLSVTPPDDAQPHYALGEQCEECLLRNTLHYWCLQIYGAAVIPGNGQKDGSQRASIPPADQEKP